MSRHLNVMEVFVVQNEKPDIRVVLQINKNLAKSLGKKEKEWLHSHVRQDFENAMQTSIITVGNLKFKRQNGEFAE